MATTQTAQIVNLSTTVTSAPAPSQLQQSGAIVSTGGTSITTGSAVYCANLAAVAAVLVAPVALSSLSWASSLVTATLASGTIPLAVGQTFTTTISGAVPAGYNGTYVATVISTTTFTFPLAATPGTETTPGTYTPPSQAFVNDAATTFFAQGTNIGVYILELGAETTAAAAITALQTWITSNSTAPQVFYAYLTPASWDQASSTALNTMAATYSSANGQTYFFITTTSSNLATYASTKSVFALVPSPTQAASEHQAAAAFYEWLVNNPSASNPLAPMGYRSLSGVTPWVQMGNGTTIQNVLTAYGNLVYPNSEGGLTGQGLWKGFLMNGVQASGWYGVDWFRIQAKQALAAAVINGSNSNPPLDYDQAGINALTAVLQQVANSAISFGCLEAATITATPFTTYTTQNPSDYANGIYNGFSALITFQNGFLTIGVAVNAIQFIG